jgi:hypothetical protein
MNFIIPIIQSLGEFHKATADYCANKGGEEEGKILKLARIARVMVSEAIITFTLLIVNQKCKVTNWGTGWPREFVNDVLIRVFVLDVPLGREVADRPLECVVIEQPAHGEVLSCEGESSGVAALVVLIGRK